MYECIHVCINGCVRYLAIRGGKEKIGMPLEWVLGETNCQNKYTLSAQHINTEIQLLYFQHLMT